MLYPSSGYTGIKFKIPKKVLISNTISTFLNIIARKKLEIGPAKYINNSLPLFNLFLSKVTHAPARDSFIFRIFLLKSAATSM